MFFVRYVWMGVFIGLGIMGAFSIMKYVTGRGLFDIEVRVEMPGPKNVMPTKEANI